MNELTPFMDASKARDLIARLDDKKRPDQALGAEWELILLWALSQLGDFEVEPEWLASADKPDAYSGTLFEREETLIEIMALSDVAISGEIEMRSVAQKICDAANKIRAGAGKHLSFRFLEETGYENGEYFRRRKVSRGFALTQDVMVSLKTWIERECEPGKPLRIVTSYVDVLVDWQDHEQRTPQVWCSMPPLVHSLDDNPLIKRLREKKRQLRGSARGARLCIFLADAGSSLLRHLHQRDPCNRTVSGSAIIQHFLKNDGDIDAVFVFAIVRDRSIFSSTWSKPRIAITTFLAPGRTSNYATSLRKIEACLPPPRFEGYQARSLVMQQAFTPTSRPWYAGTEFVHKGTGGPMIVKFSSRALLELIAGKITQTEFAKWTGVNDNSVLARLLREGFTMSAVSLQPAGLDNDDDHFVIELQRDPAASPLVAISKVGADAED
ncbi:MAG: hypothetical protein AB7I44_05600 [Hyphomicrobiaceae bacterium]